MTLWIDSPRWPAHGRLWSHLISDRSLAELHHFAESLGIPRRGFEGDHYDIPAERYDDVVAAGAQPVDGRELLRLLQASGLRMAKRKGDRGVGRALGVTFPDGTRADVDLIASPKEMTEERVFASLVLIRDASGTHLLTWSERRQEWSACGGWREEGETPLQTAVRETVEEAGVGLQPTAVQPCGYERFRPDESTGQGLWVPGRDIIQVYLTTLPETAPALRGESATLPEPVWVDDAELERRCGGLFWWPLAAYVLGVA